MKFDIVEAYSNRKGDLDAACNATRTCVNTEEALVTKHSVVSEFDYLNPYRAALRACTLRWEVATSSLGVGGFDGFPCENLFRQQKPDFDDEETFGVVEWQDQFLPQQDVQPLDPHAEDLQVPHPRTTVEASVMDSGRSITIVSFGHHNGFVGRRELVVSSKLAGEWQPQVRHQWRDHWRILPPTVHIVSQPPEDRPDTMWVIVQCDVVRHDIRSVLVQLDNDGTCKVVLIPSSSLKAHILTAYGLGVDMHEGAVVRLGLQPWLLGIPQLVSNGDFIRILLPDSAVVANRLFDERTATRSAGSEEVPAEQQPAQEPEHEGDTDFYPYHEWILLFNEADDPHQDGLQLTIYGLAEVSCGTRHVQSQRATPEAVVRVIRQQFPEYREWSLRIHMVQPQPSDDAASTHVLAEFCRPDGRMNPLLIPVVEDLRQYSQWVQEYEHRVATYKLSPISYDLMMQPHQQRCPRDGGLHCLVWCRALALEYGRQATLHRGDLVVIRIFPVEAIRHPMIGHADAMFEQIVTAIQRSPMSSVNLYFHTIDGRSSMFSVSEFHPGILIDIAAHAEFLWGTDAIVHLGTITSHSPHNFHFVIGSQGGDGQLALAAISTTSIEGQPLCAFHAVVLPQWCSITDLAAQVHLLEAHGHFSALTHNAQSWSGAPIQIHGPTFLEATIPLEYFVMGDNVVTGGDDESDVSSFMQASSSSVPTESTITITLRGLHRRLHAFELPFGQSIYEYLDQNWPFQELAHSDMVALHAVESPPSYVNQAREQMFLVECDSDRFEQVHEDDVLILVTIKYFIPGTTWQNDKVRTKVVWGPKRSTREGIMHYLRMQWFCQRPTITCELFFNEQEWGLLDSAVRHFQAGDHLRLNILSTKEKWCEFEYAEQTDRGRHFFESSPSEPQAGQEEAAEESLSPYTIRERSRSRTRSHSLLQTETKMRTGSSGMTKGQAQELSLVDKISPPVWVRIPCGDIRFLHTQILDVDLGPVLDRRQVVKWHPATLVEFESTPDWNGESVRKYSFYTDGSSVRTPDGRVGSSAIILIVDTPVGLRFGGIRAYAVPTMATAPRTEAIAMLFGLIWAHQLGHMHPSTTPFQVEFGYDCLMSGHVAAGQWSIRSNHDVQIHSRALVQWMVQKYGDCARFYHIASHTGHPWNECADAVSWSVVNQWMGSSLPVDVLQQLTFDERSTHLSSWLWMYEAALQGDPNGPLVIEDHFVYNVAAPLESAPIEQCHPLPIRQNEESPVQLRTTTEVVLSVATANVLTLYPGGEKPGSYVSARQEQLMRQCKQAGLHVVGVQESRSRVDGHRDTDDFHVISAPATAAGVGGVQLWIAKRFEFGDKEYQVSYRYLRVVHATTQRMVVAFCAPWLKLLFVVGHAPSGVDDRMKKWWISLPHIIPKAYKAWPTLYLLDANARVGSLATESVGTAGTAVENESGECFHQWMMENGLFAPQTFEKFHQGQHETWEHGRGVRARLDYVVLDKALWHPLIRTRVMTQVDLSIKRTDHFALHAEIPLRVADMAQQPRKVRPRGENGSNCSVCLPRISWQTDVHTHAAVLANSMAPLRGGKKKLRKTHLSTGTWELIQWKQFHWKRCNELRRALKMDQLRFWFVAWRCRRRPIDVGSALPWLRQTNCQLAVHMYYMMKLSPVVATQVKQDDTSFYLDLSKRTAQIAADEGIPGLWKQLRPLLPKAVSKRQSNLRCVGPTLVDTMAHFNKLEAGQEITYSALLQQCHLRQREACLEAPLLVQLADLPTMIEMEQVVMKQKRGKAPGLDQVTASTLQQAVRADPRTFYDLVLKSWLTAAEPLQYKGGIIHCIAKKSGSREVAAMRGIALLDSFAKCFHALVRKALLHWSLPRRMDTQFGGFAHQQTLFATQYVRAYTRVAAANQLSSAVLFVDVKSAFHCLLREHVFGIRSDFPPSLQAVLTEEGFKVEQLLSAIAPHAADFVQTSVPVVTRIVQETHQSTWYALSGHDACYATERGSRPGSPLADLAYNTLMTQILRQVEEELQSMPLVVQSCMAMQMSCPPVAWVDDVAIPMAATDPQTLESVLKDTTIVVHRVMQHYGLTLNMAPGKTEAVVHYRGPDAPRFRLERFIAVLGHLPLDAPLESQSLRIASDYQHLGTTFAQDASISQEVRRRIGKATAVFRQLKKPIFSNKRLGIKARLVLLDSLVLSIVFHGAGNWPLLPHRLMKTLTHTVIAWQRSIIGVGHWSEDNVSDDALLSQWGQPSVTMRLAKFRILYGLQWYQQAPGILMQLVTAEDVDDHSWLHAIRHDLAWIATLDPILVPRSPVTTEEVIEWFHDHLQGGAKSVRRAVRRAVAENQMIFEVVTLHKNIYDACGKLGVQFVHPDTPARGPDDMYPCGHCDRRFPTAQALQGHQWKKHNIFSEERRYIYSTTCAACNKCYWTVQRLQQHLKYTREQPDGCYQWLARNYAPLDAPCRIEKGHELLRFHRLPACETLGPHVDVEVPFWQRQKERRLHQLQEEWERHGFPSELRDEDRTSALHTYTEATLAHLHERDGPTLDWLVVWSGAIEVNNPTFSVDLQTWTLLEWGHYKMYEICEGIEDPDVILAMEAAFLDLAAAHPMGQLLSEWRAAQNRRAPVHPLPVVHPSRVNSQRHDRECIPRYVLMQRQLLHPYCGRVVQRSPRPRGVPVVVAEDGTETMYLLHLFSGRRRHGDVGTYLQEIWTKYFGGSKIRVVLLSMDTAVHAEHGNLDVGPAFDNLLAAAQLGAFALSLGGPPCETWSAARHLELPDNKGPRPLRSYEASWGLPNLTMREIKQLQMGSRLMLHQLRVDMEVVMRGGAAMKEHPITPRDPSYASVWRTDIHRNLMMQLVEAHELRIQQWRFGAISPKPTIIRTLGLRYMGHVFRECEDPTATYPKEILGGRDASGGFKTAAAKEYPSRLCLALTEAAIGGLHDRFRREGLHRLSGSSIPKGVYAWLTALEEASAHFSTESFLPDYQPAVE